VQTLGCLRQVPCFGHRDESTQLIKLHGAVRSAKQMAGIRNHDFIFGRRGRSMKL
jgi:hypothetical protein